MKILASFVLTEDHYFGADTVQFFPGISESLNSSAIFFLEVLKYNACQDHCKLKNGQSYLESKGLLNIRFQKFLHFDIFI